MSLSRSRRFLRCNCYDIGKGTRGKSYASSFSDGVAGADRLPTEPCGPCLTGSYPVPIALSWGNGNAPDGSEAISVGDIEAVAKYLIGIITGMTEEIILEAYVGYSNQYFYSVGDCRSEYIKNCTENWILYTRNDFVFETDTLNTVLLDSNGTFASQPSASSEEFLTTDRPWYIQQNGWADPFTAVTTGNIVRSFSADFYGGVAASEMTLGPNNTCVDGRNGIYETLFYSKGVKKCAPCWKYPCGTDQLYSNYTKTCVPNCSFYSPSNYLNLTLLNHQTGLVPGNCVRCEDA